LFIFNKSQQNSISQGTFSSFFAKIKTVMMKYFLFRRRGVAAVAVYDPRLVAVVTSLHPDSTGHSRRTKLAK